jgi:hypothetical protein
VDRHIRPRARELLVSVLVSGLLVSGQAHKT